MSRSVSVPRNAAHVVYASLNGEDFDEFEWVTEDFRSAAIQAYPSLQRANRWLGREDHVILENERVSITLSEYNGLIAVALVPLENNPLAFHWCTQVNLAPLVQCFGPVLRRTGSASNGEAFFEPVDGKQRGELGLGFTSKEGWL